MQTTPSATFRSAHSVLVVDDNPAMKYSVARALRASGYRTVEAAGGAEALELSEFVSAVVLDVHLPDVNGYEVCRLLRQRRSTARLPIIHFSAVRVDESEVQEAEDCGANAFMVAPMDPAELATRLDGLLAEWVLLEAARRAEDTGTPGDRSGSGLQSVRDQMTPLEKPRAG